MTDTSKIIIPHQDYVSIETDADDQSVEITQEGRYGEHEQAITIYGVGNIDRLIAALQDARREIGGAV